MGKEKKTASPVQTMQRATGKQWRSFETLLSRAFNKNNEILQYQDSKITANTSNPDNVGTTPMSRDLYADAFQFIASETFLAQFEQHNIEGADANTKGKNLLAAINKKTTLTAEESNFLSITPHYTQTLLSNNFPVLKLFTQRIWDLSSENPSTPKLFTGTSKNGVSPFRVFLDLTHKSGVEITISISKSLELNYDDYLPPTTASTLQQASDATSSTTPPENTGDAITLKLHFDGSCFNVQSLDCISEDHWIKDLFFNDVITQRLYQVLKPVFDIQDQKTRSQQPLATQAAVTYYEALGEDSSEQNQEAAEKALINFYANTLKNAKDEDKFLAASALLYPDGKAAENPKNLGLNLFGIADKLEKDLAEKPLTTFEEINEYERTLFAGIDQLNIAFENKPLINCSQTEHDLVCKASKIITENREQHLEKIKTATVNLSTKQRGESFCDAADLAAKLFKKMGVTVDGKLSKELNNIRANFTGKETTKSDLKNLLRALSYAMFHHTKNGKEPYYKSPEKAYKDLQAIEALINKKESKKAKTPEESTATTADDTNSTKGGDKENNNANSKTYTGAGEPVDHNGAVVAIRYRDTQCLTEEQKKELQEAQNIDGKPTWVTQQTPLVQFYLKKKATPETQTDETTSDSDSTASENESEAILTPYPLGGGSCLECYTPGLRNAVAQFYIPAKTATATATATAKEDNEKQVKTAVIPNSLYDIRSGIVVPFKIKNSNTRIEQTKLNIEQLVTLNDDAKALKPSAWNAEIKDAENNYKPVLLVQTLVRRSPGNGFSLWPSSFKMSEEHRMIKDKNNAIKALQSDTQDGATSNTYNIVGSNYGFARIGKIKTHFLPGRWTRQSYNREAFKAINQSATDFIHFVVAKGGNSNKPPSGWMYKIMSSLGLNPESEILHEQFLDNVRAGRYSADQLIPKLREQKFYKDITNDDNAAQKKAELELLVTALHQYNSIQRTLSSRAPNLINGNYQDHELTQIAAVELIIANLTGGIASSTCKSGKDRRAVLAIYKNSMLEYYEKYGVLPNCRNITTEFQVIFIRRLQSNFHQELAAESAAGSEGIKNLLTAVPRDIVARMQAIHPGYIDRQMKMAGLNKIDPKNSKEACSVSYNRLSKPPKVSPTLGRADKAGVTVSSAVEIPGKNVAGQQSDGATSTSVSPRDTSLLPSVDPDQPENSVPKTTDPNTKQTVYGQSSFFMPPVAGPAGVGSAPEGNQIEGDQIEEEEDGTDLDIGVLTT